MHDARYIELEKMTAAFEKIIQGQQKIINELVKLKVNEKTPTIKHPSLFDGNMLC